MPTPSALAERNSILRSLPAAELGPLLEHLEGIIEILDRDLLLRASCPCYAIASTNYATTMHAPRD